MLNDEVFSVLNTMETIGARIRVAREAAGMSKSDLAREVKVSPSAVTQWEDGGGIEGENLVRVAMATTVNPVWLATGKGDPHPTPIMVSVAESRSGYHSIQPHSEAVVVPVFSARASMGQGIPISDHDTVIGGMQLSDKWVSRNLPGVSSRANLAVISAIGDSMAPTFSDGDILLVDRGVFELKMDAVYVLAKNDELFVKRVHRKLGGGVEIKSDNPLHGSEVVEDPESVGLRILGRVIWAWNGKRL
jgi:phage repressor protein C with HTH and peptisase S24 domain